MSWQTKIERVNIEIVIGRQFNCFSMRWQRLISSWFDQFDDSEKVWLTKLRDVLGMPH